MKILSFLFALLLVVFHGAAGFAKPPRSFVRCGYRGTFCHPGICPRSNAYLGVCRPGYSCCRW
ncbi:gallinacin-4-like [Colius striatus]|uniref:gallinacin-4-like n=1 Tax=Colius striatus TaxID=57412 RepID=UPI002B1CF9B5|nr:gallinacin-4-like [Colius striatus]